MNSHHSHGIARRRFIHSAVVLGAAGLWLPRWARAAAIPNTNPTRALGLAWTDKLRWDFAVDITSVAGAGEFWDERLEQAQRAVVAKDGEVVFFPAGTYRFADDIQLQSGVILRGAEPVGTASAREGKFSLPSKLEFPKYTPGFTGSGTPVDTAFKGIVLADPATAANCGVVHLALNRGCITFVEADGHRCGANRLVFGCVLRNAAGVMAEVPNAQQNQPAWLRYTHKFRSAIRVHAAENVLVANNRLHKSGDDNFTMHDYLSLFHVGEISGLHVEGNDISTQAGDSDIYVTAPRHKQPGDFPIRRVTIVKNITRTNGIRVMGWPSEKVVVKDNRHLGAKPGKLINEANAELANNTHYEVSTPARKG